MTEQKLTLTKRTITGKKVAALRRNSLIPSVVYGKGLDPVLTSSDYNATVKVLHSAGFHSPIELDIDGKKQLAIAKQVALDPGTRRIINVEFKAISATAVVEATTPIVIQGFAESAAHKAHLNLSQIMTEITVKAKPNKLPTELTIDASQLAQPEDRLTIADLKLPAGVAIADPELTSDALIANLFDPVAEAAAREAREAAEATESTENVENTTADNGATAEEVPEAAASDSASDATENSTEAFAA